MTGGGGGVRGLHRDRQQLSAALGIALGYAHKMQTHAYAQACARALFATTHE